MKLYKKGLKVTTNCSFHQESCGGHVNLAGQTFFDHFWESVENLLLFLFEKLKNDKWKIQKQMSDCRFEIKLNVKKFPSLLVLLSIDVVLVVVL